MRGNETDSYSTKIKYGSAEAKRRFCRAVIETGEARDIAMTAP